MPHDADIDHYGWCIDAPATPDAPRDTSLDHVWHDQVDFDALRAIYDRIDRVLQFAIPMIVTALGVLVFTRAIYGAWMRHPA